MPTSPPIADAGLPWLRSLSTEATDAVPLVINGRAVHTANVHEYAARGASALIRRVCFADAKLVAEAALASDAARPPCAALTRKERSDILRSMAERLESGLDELGYSIALEVGKSLSDSKGEVTRAISTLRSAADSVSAFVGSEVAVDSVDVGKDRFAYTIWQPIGVISAICGFNFPLLLAVHKLAAAIGAGCPILLKPSERTPFTTIVLADAAINAGWPAEGISILNGLADVGEAMSTHPVVRLVSFTGSSAVGAKIAASAGAHLKRVVLELGSTAATIVTDDADLDLAAERCAAGAVASSGQSCISVQRILVQSNVADKFGELLAEKFLGLTAGDPLDGASIGRLVSDAEENRVRGLIENAIGNGARLLAGPGTLEAIAPTLLTNVPLTAEIAQLEVFGPVAGIFTFTDDDEAVALANSTPYGLMAGVFTGSLDRAMFFAQNIEAGGVHINDSSNFRPDNIPYGGVKASGIGKEGPAYAMREMSNEKVITLRLPRSTS